MTVIILIGCVYLICQLCAWHINNYLIILIKELLILKFVESAEHRTVTHIMTVYQRYTIGKILFIRHFGIDASVNRRIPVHIMLEIKIIRCIGAL